MSLFHTPGTAREIKNFTRRSRLDRSRAGGHSAFTTRICKDDLRRARRLHRSLRRGLRRRRLRHDAVPPRAGPGQGIRIGRSPAERGDGHAAQSGPLQLGLAQRQFLFLEVELVVHLLQQLVREVITAVVLSGTTDQNMRRSCKFFFQGFIEKVIQKFKKIQKIQI